MLEKKMRLNQRPGVGEWQTQRMVCSFHAQNSFVLRKNPDALRRAAVIADLTNDDAFPSPAAT
jgi:hypothetical protein